MSVLSMMDEKPNLLVKSIHENAVLPTRSHEWDAGLDLYAAEPRHLFHRHVVGVRTGIQMAIPQGHFGLMAIRSSFGRRGIQLANAPAIIDAGYRGEIIMMLTVPNESFNFFYINRGEKIAQMVIIPIPLFKPIWSKNLPSSDGRNEGGFGSSGRL